jgi:hypothetical protein
MAVSAFQKLQFATIGLLAIGGAVFYVGFWAPFGGRQTSTGAVQSAQALTVDMVKGGQTLSSHDATLYAVALDGQSEPVMFQEPSASPTFANGQRVSVTWSKRGLFGKPLVFEMK